MGNATSWITQNFCPEEQIVWAAAKTGDLVTLQQALTRLTPENRVYLEWKDPLHNYTPLATACVEGHLRCVVALLAVGVDVNARDGKGFMPLHLAVLNGRSEIVRLLLDHPTVDVHGRTVVKRQSPLDLARHEFNHAYDSNVRTVQCIELLEKKLCVYSGWLYQRADNILSLASGISSLNSWKKRYCMVLRTADVNVIEIDLFSMRPGEKRPPCPTLSDGLDQSQDATWFNRKEHRFSLNAYTKSGISRVSAPQSFDFAATSEADLVAWKAFFGSMRMGVLPTSAANAAAASPAAPASPAPTSSMLDDQQSLERALQLSLEDARRHSASMALVTPAFSAPPSVGSSAVASAPPWNDTMLGSPQATLAPDGVEIVQQLQMAPDASYISSSQASGEQMNDDAGGARNECVICFDGPQSAVCVPCGHNAVCMDCATELLRSTRQCPVCRSTVREIVKIYRV